jgi:Zn-finger nucleic acid-binding protein
VTRCSRAALSAAPASPRSRATGAEGCGSATTSSERSWTARGPSGRPTNFGRRSGILVDQCRDHGVWLDGDELARILRWIRSGGESLATERDREDERAAASAARFRVEPRAPDETPFAAKDDWREGTSLLGALARLLATRT